MQKGELPSPKSMRIGCPNQRIYTYLLLLFFILLLSFFFKLISMNEGIFDAISPFLRRDYFNCIRTNSLKMSTDMKFVYSSSKTTPLPIFFLLLINIFCSFFHIFVHNVAAKKRQLSNANLRTCWMFTTCKLICFCMKT